MFIWGVLDHLTKLTTGTDIDDRVVDNLQQFFLSHPQLRANVFGVIYRGWLNGFDFNDEMWTADLMAVIFDVVRTKYEQ